MKATAQSPDFGFAEAMAKTVASKLSDSEVTQGGVRQEIFYASVGGGGIVPERSVRNAYMEFVEDKRKSPCSLEQFVVVGFSDGATAAYNLIRGNVFATEYPPAFIGLMDLVRTDYGLGNINTSATGTADIVSHKPPVTGIENWYQTTGNPSANLGFIDRGFMGRVVNGADQNINIKIWRPNLGHGGLYADGRVRAAVCASAASWYRFGAEQEAKRTGKPVPWVLGKGEHW